MWNITTNLINRYEKCKGFTFFKSSCYHLEIWWVQGKYSIIPHSHELEDIKLVFLLGHKVEFWRWHKGEVKTQNMKCWNLGKVFSIPAGAVHWFKNNSRLPLVFLNIAKFKNGHKPISACEDFIKL
jgi:hypothetical protein